MREKIFSTFILVSFFLAGCAGTNNVAISDINKDKIKNHTITVAKRDTPGFYAYNTGKAMFGLIGAAAMYSEGNKIISDNNVDDPANYISEQLLSSLSENYQLNQIDGNNIKLKNEDVEDISRLFKDADYVIDVKTEDWKYIPGHVSTKYRVLYSAELQLIDTNEKSIIAEGHCSRIPKKDDPDFSYDELIDNDAEGLKRELKIKAESCVDYFKENTLALD